MDKTTEASNVTRPWQLLTLSADSMASLDNLTAQLLGYMKAQSAAELADLAYTLQLSQPLRGPRRAVVSNGWQELVSTLEARDERKILTSPSPAHRPPVAFMFTGLGDQYVDMGLELYQCEPVFRQQVDLCAELLKPQLGLDIREVLYPKGTAPRAGSADEKPKVDLRQMLFGGAAQADEATQRLNQTYITQPLMFVIEYALARLWISWGITPSALIGYSIGEYVVACLAGVFSLEDGLMLIASRAKMMQEMPGGAMLAVPLSEEQTKPYLGELLSIAAINGSAITVVSGPNDAIAELEERLTKQELACRRLQTTHAFHSKMMAPLTEAVTKLASTIKLNPPQIPYVSTVTGTWITESEALDPSYWSRHMCQAVRFADGLRELSKDARLILLEVGPGQTLSTMAVQNQEPHDAERQVLSTLRSRFYRQSDVAFLLSSLAKLWLAGVAVDWTAFYAGQARQVLALPDTVTARGVSEHIAELQAALNAHPAVQQALVVSRDGQAGSAEQVVAYVVPKRRFSTHVDGHLRYALPNNMAVAQLNRNETDHLYQDIFIDRAYFKNGITLPQGACIFDIGANIGMFTLFVSQHCLRPRIYAFEPIPPIFEALRINAGLYGSEVKLFQIGLAEAEKVERFTYYPRYSVMSGLSAYANAQEDLNVVKTVMVNERQSNSSELSILLEHADQLFAGRFESTTYECRLRALSDVIKEAGVERIDLLKIDVQRAELDVLRGIRAEDWSKIEQIVAEVHDDQGKDEGGRVGEIVQILQSQGFTTVVEQDELFKGTDHFNIYARRGQIGGTGAVTELKPVVEFGSPFLSVEQLRDDLKQSIKLERLPDAFVILESLPLLPDGEVDYAALPVPAELAGGSAAVLPPESANWFYWPSWEQSVPPALTAKESAVLPARVVLLISAGALADKIAQRLAATGLDITTVKADPQAEQDYARLLQADNKARLVVISDETQAVTGEEQLSPQRVALISAAQASMRKKGSACRTIDIDIPAAGSWQEQRLIDYLVAEVLTGEGQPVIAYRRLNRWVQSYRSVNNLVPASMLSQRDQTCLVIAPLDGEGARLAEQWARTQPGKIVMAATDALSERELSSRATALAAAGAHVTALNANLEDATEMLAALTRIRTQFGPIKGVVVQTPRERAAERALPVLAQLLADWPIDFCILQSLWSDERRHFVDAFVARHNRQQPVPWLSVTLDHEETALSVSECGEVFQRILPLAGRLDQVLFSRRGVAAEEMSALSNWRQRPNLRNAFVAPRNPVEEAIAEIWQELLGIKPVGVHDIFFELGGHSLLAIQVVARMKERLKVEIELRELFEAPTIADLAATVKN